jgi:PKD repeat protein
LLVTALCQCGKAAEVISAKDTLTVLEMDPGDELQFTLRNGRTVSLVLKDTMAAIIERVEPGGIIYQFSCRVLIDGQPMTLRRFVCSQECFYEPYVVDGLRIWLDTVRDVFDLIPVRYPRQGNLQCVPRKAARLAVQDATLRICPIPLHPWLEEEHDFLDVGRCYNGDDCYLGPYLGQACHVGLDLNHARGSRLLAPLDFDTQAYFESLALGDENNRWRGIRRWDNGDVWALQTHHLIDLLVPPNTPLKAGTPYATTAGVHVGSHEHTHFEFKIGRKPSRTGTPARQDVGDGQESDDPASIACPINFDGESEAAQQHPEVLHLDPWIVFWQIFEDRRTQRGDIRAAIKPLVPASTGEPVVFSAEGSCAGRARKTLSYLWSFGDGGAGIGPGPTHTFARPGVYPVTLVVDDGRGRATCTQHIVVCGESVTAPVLALVAPDEPSFRPRPVHATDVYGWPVKSMPHTLRLVAHLSRPIPNRKSVKLQNVGGGPFAPTNSAQVSTAERCRWLKTDVAGTDDEQTVHVGVDATGLEPGEYVNLVTVDCPGALNSPQSFRVELKVREDAPAEDVTVDDRDDVFYATPHFWVGHRFCRCPANRRGYKGFYLTNGEQPRAGEFARFTPDLKAGAYQVSLSDATPFRPGTEFDLRVRHRAGETVVRVRPSDSRRIGRFEFDEGTDGFVEILAQGSNGLVIADAVVFRADR